MKIREKLYLHATVMCMTILSHHEPSYTDKTYLPFSVSLCFELSIKLDLLCDLLASRLARVVERPLWKGIGPGFDCQTRMSYSSTAKVSFQKIHGFPLYLNDTIVWMKTSLYHKGY